MAQEILRVVSPYLWQCFCFLPRPTLPKTHTCWGSSIFSNPSLVTGNQLSRECSRFGRLRDSVIMNSAILRPSWQAEVHRALGCSANHHTHAETSQEERVFQVANLQGSQRQSRILDEQIRISSPAAMDPEIWGNLPIHLLESILAWLPVSTLLKLRCVCKRFNNIIYSPTLWETLRRINPCVIGWYLFRGEGREYVAFNPETDSWCKLPLEFLPSSKTKGIRVVAAAGGLLCVLQGEKTIVCNPLRNAWLELPPRRNTWKFPIVGL